MDSSALQYEAIKYGQHDLQTIGLWRKAGESSATGKTWIIYLHGGAWRDPRKTHLDFIPTLNRFLALPESSRVAGYASIDYRLSPHPEFPQDPASTPPEQLRNATHPAHLQDVWAALGVLQQSYGFGSDYIVVGHSAGATMAYQMLMGAAALGQGAEVPSGVELPKAVVGFQGIYDLRGLVDRFGPGYASFITAAFGDPSTWDRASPMKYTGGFRSNWEGGKVAVLGRSPDDELVDALELEGMAEVLEREQVNHLVFKDMKGTHDGVWQDGQHVARLIAETIKVVYT
ncbi:hypothetical protein PG995_008211 [Apiospora arundinis]|uniref:Kynurenine formamidase n=1 Tax=Apiospora arundinis TaxID=335852 RepID=A0ABR2HZQ0_9PEZI